jgi:hypothetical protein
MRAMKAPPGENEKQNDGNEETVMKTRAEGIFLLIFTLAQREGPPRLPVTCFMDVFHWYRRTGREHLVGGMSER